MLLDKKQEQTLFRRIKAGDRKAKDILIKSNLFLVENVAKKYVDDQTKYSIRELISAGRRGLNKAFEHFNPSSGYKFSTYATWWIRQEIHNKLGILE